MTGFEPAVSALTGQRVWPLHHTPNGPHLTMSQESASSRSARPERISPRVHALYRRRPSRLWQDAPMAFPATLRPACRRSPCARKARSELAPEGRAQNLSAHPPYSAAAAVHKLTSLAAGGAPIRQAISPPGRDSQPIQSAGGRALPRSNPALDLAVAADGMNPTRCASKPWRTARRPRPAPQGGWAGAPPATQAEAWCAALARVGFDRPRCCRSGRGRRPSTPPPGLDRRSSSARPTAHAADPPHGSAHVRRAGARAARRHPTEPTAPA